MTVDTEAERALDDRSSPLDKVFKLLQVMSATQRPMTLVDLSRALELPKTTVHRIVTQLERMNYVQREPGGRHLAIAPGLVQLALGIAEASSRTGPRHEILRDLSRRLNESVALGLRVGHEIAYLDDIVAEHSPLNFRFRTGLRAPLHSTSIGKLYLSEMKPAEFDKVLSRPLVQFTPATITDPARLRAEVDHVRQEQFAVSCEEFVPGVSGAAVPVRRGRKPMIAALSVSAPSVRVSRDHLMRLRRDLEEAAAKIAETFLDR
jgi:IclR family transcriptional regulator, acetate operon repressor